MGNLVERAGFNVGGSAFTRAMEISNTIMKRFHERQGTKDSPTVQQGLRGAMCKVLFATIRKRQQAKCEFERIRCLKNYDVSSTMSLVK